jgi:hypothetical protein
MSKVFGILLIVGMIWIGLELFLEGPSHAFGGAFAEYLAPDADPNEEALTTPQRAGAAVARAHQVEDERRERMLKE